MTAFFSYCDLFFFIGFLFGFLLRVVNQTPAFIPITSRSRPDTVLRSCRLQSHRFLSAGCLDISCPDVRWRFSGFFQGQHLKSPGSHMHRCLLSARPVGIQAWPAGFFTGAFCFQFQIINTAKHNKDTKCSQKYGKITVHIIGFRTVSPGCLTKRLVPPDLLLWCGQLWFCLIFTNRMLWLTVLSPLRNFLDFSDSVAINIHILWTSFYLTQYSYVCLSPPFFTLLLNFFFKNSKLSTLRTRVFFHFFITWKNWLPCDNSPLGFLSAHTYRKIRWTGTRVLIFSKKLFSQFCLPVNGT